MDQSGLGLGAKTKIPKTIKKQHTKSLKNEISIS
jgi:hypothetical protein